MFHEWHNALAGDHSAQIAWSIEDGEWIWHPHGVWGRGNGTEWSAFRYGGGTPWLPAGTSSMNIHLTVRGNADAAGMSFGPYKDFLATLPPEGATRRLELQISSEGGWAFYVDGARMHRCWWDGGVKHSADLLNGAFTLKARSLTEVSFEQLRIEPSPGSCRLSVIMTCYRFLQRLRVSLRHWCHQDLRPGEYELVIVNPQSPDGTHEYLQMAASSYPEVPIREIGVARELASNKGAMINRASQAVRGEWLWITDADCLFPPNCARTILDRIDNDTEHVFFCERRHLSREDVDAVLVGRLDSLQHFNALSRASQTRFGDAAPFGYTQIVHRSVAGRVQYREDINNFAFSDQSFVAECQRRGLTPEQIEGLVCLHMVHPFSWWGTDTFL